MTMEHYLEADLRELFQTPSIFMWLDLSVCDGLWYWDLEKPENQWLSPNWFLTLGVPSDKQVFNPSAWRSRIHPKDLKKALDLYDDHLNDGVPYILRVRYRHENGEWLHILFPRS